MPNLFRPTIIPTIQNSISNKSFNQPMWHPILQLLCVITIYPLCHISEVTIKLALELYAFLILNARGKYGRNNLYSCLFPFTLSFFTAKRPLCQFLSPCSIEHLNICQNRQSFYLPKWAQYPPPSACPGDLSGVVPMSSIGTKSEALGEGGCVEGW